MTRVVIMLGLCCFMGHPTGWAQDDLTKETASRALRRAVDFFRKDVSINGAYLWRYSADLKFREGENRATATTAWVQPPGTPSVGEAFLFAFQATGDSHYLDAARETAHALAEGQLESGGWDYRIEFSPADRKRYDYRLDGGGERNVTTLDDDTTQSAIRFLMRIDQALEFKDEKIHNAVLYALDHLLTAQYPNGAWPQRFDEPPVASQHPVLKASYPETWPRVHPDEDYRGYYTFNDNSIADTIDLMFDAARIYNDQRFEQAARRGGDFILLAQMPEPQPAWAQQYDKQMHPVWARRFEPPSVTGGESQGILRVLMSIYRETGDKKYLQPIPSALKYLQSSKLPDGRLARFYELKTNRPLYFTKTYELTYSDDDLPTHYAFQVGSRLDSIQAEYDKLAAADPSALRPRETTPTYRMSGSLRQAALRAVQTMDERGAWVEPGRLRAFEDAPATQVIQTRTFIENVETLSRFIAASQ